MTPEVEVLFHDLADLDGLERSRYFGAHPIDPELRRYVEALLACDGPSPKDLDLLIGEQIENTLAHGPSATGARVFGAYRVLRMLGQGGMSEVWLAERTDGLLKRPVALKLPFAGIRGSHFAERLRRERDILASLEHRSIARLYDAGVAEGERPYLAIEYVDGVDLSAHCKAASLPVRSRLQLFLQVLEAVQYAHSRLVIHRDLKPSNILVTAGGEVKLLDFGIAKLMTGGEALETELTQMEGRALTPSFASPEQISGQPVTTASDVFSLGLILFELISGGHPFHRAGQTKGAEEDAVLHDDARRPSQTVTSDEQATERATSRRKLESALKGDLDLITLKAIQQRAESRYATADAFRADILRYLNGEAVLAQPEAVRYRLGKFISRHKLVLVAACAVFLALTGGLGVALWQAGIARREARTAETVQAFTEDIFRMNSRANPDPIKAQQTTARQLLDMGAKKASAGLGDAPEARLRMLEMLGSLYQDLGLEDTAVTLQQERVAALKKFRGARSPEVADALVDLGSSMHASRSANQAQAVLLEAQGILDSRGDTTSKTRGRELSFLAENYTSTDIQKAAVLARESIKVLGRWPDSQEYATALYTAGFAYMTAGQLADAETVSTQAIALSKRLNGDPNPDLPRYYAHAAQAHVALLRYSEAESSYRQAYQYARKLGGDEDVDTLETESRLGTFLVHTSRSKQALPYLEKAVADCLRGKGADDPFYTPQMELQYGVGLDVNGRPEQSLEQISKAVASRRLHRPGTAYLGQMLESQALVFAETGRYPMAEQALAEDLSILHKVKRPAGGYDNTRVQLALLKGRPDEAAALLKPPESRYRLEPDAFESGLRNLRAWAEIALQRGNGAEAVSLSRRMQEWLRAAGMERWLHAWQVRALAMEGAGYLLERNPASAVTALQQAVDSEAELLDASSPELAATEALLGTACLQAGDRGKAKSLLANAQGRLKSHGALSDYYRKPVRDLAQQLAR